MVIYWHGHLAEVATLAAEVLVTDCWPAAEEVVTLPQLSLPARGAAPADRAERPVAAPAAADAQPAEERPANSCTSSGEAGGPGSPGSAATSIEAGGLAAAGAQAGCERGGARLEGGALEAPDLQGRCKVLFAGRAFGYGFQFTQEALRRSPHVEVRVQLHMDICTRRRV